MVSNEISPFNIDKTSLKNIQNFDFLLQLDAIWPTVIGQLYNDIRIYFFNFMKKKYVGIARDTINRYGPVTN